MREALATLLGPALLCALAGFTTPPVDPIDVTPPSDVANHYAIEVAHPPPLIMAAADATWDYDAPEVTVAPPPKRTYIPRDYGPLPELKGPILLDASQYIGTPYVHGGESPDEGFDCSGFVQYVYADVGISVPRTTDAIYRAGTVTTDPQPGDVIYWSSGHVALYVAPGWRLDANHAGDVVNIRPIYGNPTYITFR